MGLHTVFALACAMSVRQVPYWLPRDIEPQNLRAANMNWFRQARLGMFIHWGVWGPKHAEWAMFYDKIPLDEYQKLAARFRGDDFRAERIVSLAKRNGFRYITFVAKHHDGFCLWRSKWTSWDSSDYPVRRDFVHELAAECRKQNIPLFIYYSLGIDWAHPAFLPRSRYQFARSGTPASDASEQAWNPARFEEYRKYCLNQLTELCKNYGPIAGFWFDPLGGVLANEDLFRTEEFYLQIRKLQPQALILFKTGVTGTEDVLVGERELAPIGIHYPGTDPQSVKIRALADIAWAKNSEKQAEIAVTSQGSWCWNPKATCLPADQLYRMLEGASKHSANLLLNFGPKYQGDIPEDVEREFNGLGNLIRARGYPILNPDWKRHRTNRSPVDPVKGNTGG